MALRATKGYENAARSLVGSILCAASSRERFPARSVLLLFTCVLLGLVTVLFLSRIGRGKA